MLTIDHANIDRSVLTIERTNAHHDPDGQVYPWRDLYPLVGQTVYCDGQLWMVAHKERCPAGDSCDLGIVSLVRIGEPNSDARETLTACRYELRPVLWTQDDESVFGQRDHV